MPTGIGRRLTLGEWYEHRFITPEERAASSVTIEQTSVYLEQWGDLIQIITCYCGHTEWEHTTKGCTHHDAKWSHASKFLKNMHTCQCREFMPARYASADTWDE